MIRIGTAGWAIPRQHARHFPKLGTLLERYATRFNCAEINSTFYRSHMRSTYERWSSAVPGGFRFAVKVPKTITHERKLVRVKGLVKAFVKEIGALGETLGPILVQFPGKFEFDIGCAQPFFEYLRDQTESPLVCEPRHATWFGEAAARLFEDNRVARVAADPARVPEAAAPGGWTGFSYFRLHGSPRMYFTPYGPDRLRDVAEQLKGNEADDVWCILDNTGSGAAAGDALDLVEATRVHAPPRRATMRKGP